MWGFEPQPKAPQASMLPLHHTGSNFLFVGLGASSATFGEAFAFFVSFKIYRSTEFSTIHFIHLSFCSFFKFCVFLIPVLSCFPFCFPVAYCTEIFAFKVIHYFSPFPWPDAQTERAVISRCPASTQMGEALEVGFRLFPAFAFVHHWT